MITRMKIMLPDGTEEIRELDLPPNPGYYALADLVKPILAEHELEHVNVMASFDEGGLSVHLDMFVDERGHVRDLKRNEAATKLYRNATLTRRPETDPEALEFIVGPAILFDRRVWF